jgi:membrane protease YdiL (CAAX protease family)
MRAPVAAVVWNREERRPRALWRILLTIAALVLGSIGLSVLVALAFGGVVAEFAVLPLDGALVRSSLLGLLVVTAVALSGVALDRRRLTDFGFRIDREWWADLGFGLALGAALMTAIFLVELAAGWVRVTGVLNAPSGSLAGPLLAALALFVLVGVYEELFARGYLLTNVAEGLSRFGTAVAVAAGTVVSAAVFGLLHAGNPNATLVSVLGVALAGVTLALGYALTGELAVPIGFHVSWNFFQGAVYGFPVSGLALPASIVAIRQRGPAVATGGAFGPEAGLLGIGAVLLGAGCTALWSRRRGGEIAIAEGIVVPDLRWADDEKGRERD